MSPIIRLNISAQISVQAADVKSVLKAYSIEVAAQSKDDLKEDPIIKRLRKVRDTRMFTYSLPIDGIDSGRRRQLRWHIILLILGFENFSS